MGYRQSTLERLAQNNKLARFRTRGRPDSFWGNETTLFLNDEVASSRVDDSHMGFKRRRNMPK
jgi:CelD/BcsL family acetyltransferase involved in cellulose biosynthesis